MDDGNGTVSYTVKELLARQDGKLDTIILTLAAKADKADVDNLAGRVTTLETLQARQTGSQGLFWRAAPILVALASVGIAVLAIVR